MRYLLFIPLLALTLGTAAPLTDSQRTRLETADDQSTTIDESAFYALLENAKTWTLGESGATIPDYDEMRSDPAKWRGKLCLIEGVLVTQLPPLHLSRSGWDHIGNLLIQVNHFEKSIDQLTADNVVEVYLTDPPKLSLPILQLTRGFYVESGSKIRLVARFYKNEIDKDRNNVQRKYLAFVGKSVEKIESDKSASSIYVFAAVMAAIVLFGGWLFFRLLKRGKSTFTSPQRMAEYLAGKRAARDAGDIVEAEDDDADLPEDPADALGTLSHMHEDNRQSHLE